MIPTDEQIHEARAHQDAHGTPTPDHPVPERRETIEAQIVWLIEGKRRAVYLPNGSYHPELPAGMESQSFDIGTFYFNPKFVSVHQVVAAVDERTIGHLLGYGIAEKPQLSKTIGAVVIRGANGIEKQAVAVDNPHLSAVVDAAMKMCGPTDTIYFENTNKVIEGRMNS